MGRIGRKKLGAAEKQDWVKRWKGRLGNKYLYLLQFTCDLSLRYLQLKAIKDYL
jgi:hypothetical protein